MNIKNTKRYSKQRECILNTLEGTSLHPTANLVYDEVRKEIPNISLGTVYRNLAQLCEEGIISKVETSDGAERYDFRSYPHYHLYCKSCGSVVDIALDYTNSLDHLAEKAGSVKIDYHALVFYGLCEQCNKKN